MLSILEIVDGGRVELMGGLSFFSFLLVVAFCLVTRDCYQKVWCFGGLCSINMWASVYGAHLRLHYQQFPVIVLPLLLHCYLHRIFGSIAWIGVSQCHRLVTVYKSGIGICLVKGTGSYNPQSYYSCLTRSAQGCAH